MSKNSGSYTARQLKGIYAPECREPDRQFGLNRPGQYTNRGFLPVNPGKRLSFTAPELADRFNPLGKLRFSASIVLRGKNEIIDVPSGSDANLNSSVGKIINNRPFFGRPNWMMQ